MTNSLKNEGNAGKNLRKLFILFLLFTLVITTGSFVLRYSIVQKLNKLGEQLKEPPQTPEMTNLLLELNSAETDFQQAGIYGHTGKLADYKQKLNHVFKRLDTLFSKYLADSARYLPGSRQQITQSLRQKLLLSQKVVVLKQVFDSLLKVTTIANINLQATNTLPPVLPYRHRTQKYTGDTTVKLQTTTDKNGLLKRLKDAIINKNQAQVKILTIRREKQLKDSISRSVYQKSKNSLGKLLQELNRKNGLLQQSSKQLIAANLNLVAQLHELLQQLDSIHLSDWQKSRSSTLGQYREATTEMNTFTGIAMTMVLVFVILLIVYISKAGEAEQNYLWENERAVALANQKSEILATMSHEIRNPLTAIMGAIYMLNKTALSEDQQKKASSINISSALLMETINNILDVSKMEYQPNDTLVSIDFSPIYEIKQAADAMAFMAENKGLLLSVDFEGDEHMIVKGDAFRLKQIMMNLLSNAIKYTDAGSVMIKASLRRAGEHKAELEVSVADTGVGIPKEQQIRLFDRYYQAHNSKEKPGTGLGLYICRKLISLQKGHIRVESEVGRGCNFKFNIPYEW